MSTPSTPGAKAVADMLAQRTAGKPAAAAAHAPAPAAKPAKATARPSFPRPNGTFYYPRIIEGTKHDVDLLRDARGVTINDNLYVLFYGAPGTGKTACVDAAFPNVVVLPGHGDTTVDDFVGGWVQNPDGTYTWVDGPLVTAMEEGRPFFIDEIARIDTGVLAVVYAVMDGRRDLRIAGNPARVSADPDVPNGIVRAKDGFYVVGACNPNAAGSHMDEALLSRFLIQIESTTDYDLAKEIGVPSKMITVAKNLATKQANHEISWAPQMRELLAFKRISERFSQNMAVANMIGVAPEDDRAVVADVISRAFGAAVAPLRQNQAAL